MAQPINTSIELTRDIDGAQIALLSLTNTRRRLKILANDLPKVLKAIGSSPLHLRGVKYQSVRASLRVKEYDVIAIDRVIHPLPRGRHMLHIDADPCNCRADNLTQKRKDSSCISGARKLLAQVDPEALARFDRQQQAAA